MDRGVRLAMESGRPISEVARDLGVHPEALRRRVRRAQADAGERGDVLTTAEREEIKQLREEVFELRRANEDTTHCPPRGFAGAGACGAAMSPVGGPLA